MKLKHEINVGMLAFVLLSSGFNLVSSTNSSDSNHKIKTLSDQTFGGLETEYAYDVTNTSDGGAIIAGHTTSFGAGELDAYIIKIDAEGDLQWNQTIGGSNPDVAISISR